MLQCNYCVIYKVLTHGEGTEHLGQCIGQLLVALVHLQIYLTQIWSAVHTNLHKCCTGAGAGAGAGAVRLLTFLARVLLSHGILAIRSHWWPTYNLFPEINPIHISLLNIYIYTQKEKSYKNLVRIDDLLCWWLCWILGARREEILFLWRSILDILIQIHCFLRPKIEFQINSLRKTSLPGNLGCFRFSFATTRQPQTKFSLFKVQISISH